MPNAKWLWAALLLSVGVNVALAGFVVGHLTRPGPVPAGLDPSLSLYRVVGDLPEQRRREIHEALSSHYRLIRTDLRRMRAAQRGINDALRREPFDAADLDAALGRFRAALLDGQQDNHRVLVRVAESMTPGERHALLNAMVRRPVDHRHPNVHPEQPRPATSRQ